LFIFIYIYNTSLWLHNTSSIDEAQNQ